MNKVSQFAVLIVVGILCTQTLYSSLNSKSEVSSKSSEKHFIRSENLSTSSIEFLEGSSTAITLSGVLPKELSLGCFDLKSIAGSLNSALQLFSGLNSETKSIIDTSVSAIVMGLNKSNITKALASSNGCLGNFDGSSATGINECSAMLLADNSEYSVLSFNVPIPEGTCSAAPALTKATFCVAMAHHNGLPSLSIQANAGALSCLATAAGSGVGYVIGTAIEAGLDKVSLGVSLTSSYVKTAPIFTGKIEDVQMNGNYYDYVGIDINPEKFNLPKVFQISGSATRVLKVMDNAETWVNGLSSAKNIKDVVELFGDISMLLSLEAKLSLALSGQTKGFLPDLGPYQLGQGSLYATTFPATLESGQTLQRGIYGYVSAKNILPAVIADLIKGVINKVGGILNTVLSEFGLGISDILGRVTPTSSVGNNEFGFMITSEEIGLLVQTSLKGITGIIPDDSKIKIHCSFKYDGDKFSCKMDLGSLSKFFTGLINDAVWVIKEAKQLFDETGKVIAFVDKKLASFTDKAIQTTANGIKTGAITVAGYTAEAATWAAKAVYHCGIETVTDIAKCGTSVVTDAAVCGFDYVTDAAKCGADVVTDAAKCGTSYVTSGVKCGYQTVTDAAKCGVNVITDGAKCGWNTVTECIKNLFKLKFSCTSSQQAKSCEIAKSCQIETSCNIPNTCSIAKSCSFPKTCHIAATCAIAKNC